MQRAFDLALLGAGNVAPNPLVGCVIVKNDGIIGEGYHTSFGSPHAEVEAIRSISPDESAENATAYVTLEPCSHHGKTPPCADLLIDQKIKKVYIANLDPNPLVAGKGIQKLQDAGIEVETGLLSEVGEQMNEKFFTYHRKKRPFITVKFACSKDQFIAQKDGKAVQFSNELSKIFVHQLRAEHQGILIGVKTANADNPSLTTRHWPGKSPIRLIIDPNNRMNRDLQILKDEHPCFIFTRDYSHKESHKIWIAVGNFQGAEFIEKVMSKCFELGIQSILVEGGSQTIQYLLEAKLIDKIYKIESNLVLKEGILAPQLSIQFSREQQLGSDNWIKMGKLNF